jgi:hypothetical protein
MIFFSIVSRLGGIHYLLNISIANGLSNPDWHL